MNALNRFCGLSGRPIRRTVRVLSMLFPAILLTACGEEVQMVNLGIDDTYYINRMQKLDLHPALTGDSYQWSIVSDDGVETLVSEDRDYIFLASDEGVYNMKFEIIDSETPYEFTFKINVMHEEVEYSPYISNVYEYCPAPGQFVNEMPRFEDGDTYESILKKTEESISGTNDVMISLGGYGGYVTFGFDHTVINREGNDFRIWGNCFYELLHPEKKGGSAEPGIVCVSYDVNCNGIPDDPWYELAGSEYNSPSTVHNYTITYYRSASDKEVSGDDNDYLKDGHYIRWDDSEGATGYMAKNSFHVQDYWPKWVSGDKMSFTGSLLAPNAEDVSGNGSYYVLYSYPWGYADNHPNEYEELNSFDISNAVDAEGNKVDLPGVDFIRVYTGVNQYCGWIGETSTEICRAQDLNITPTSTVFTVSEPSNCRNNK